MKTLGKLSPSAIGKALAAQPQQRALLPAAFSFSLNLLYALYHGALGVADRSLWFLAMCAYYLILATVRFAAVLCGRGRGAASKGYFIMTLSGALLILLCFVLAAVVCISLSQNIAAKHGTVVMITIAAYTFCKIAAAAVKAGKGRCDPSPALAVVRTAGYAEIAASVLTLQRSMLVSFGAMGHSEMLRMNACTGAAVCLFVLALGVAMLAGAKKERSVSQWQDQNL